MEGLPAVPVGWGTVTVMVVELMHEEEATGLEGLPEDTGYSGTLEEASGTLEEAE